MNSNIFCGTWQYYNNDNHLQHLLVNGIILLKVMANRFVILTFRKFLLHYLFGANNRIMWLMEHTAMQAINETFSCWKSQAKQRNEKKKGINKHDASFYDLHLFELVIPQIPTTQHVLKFENMKVYFHFQVQNRKLFASLLTGHSLQGISCSVLNKSRKSKIHKLGFDTPNVASVQKHKYIELQYLKRRKLFYLKDHFL